MKRAQYVVSSLFAGTLALGCVSNDPGDATQGAAASTTSTSSGNQSGSVTSAPGSATDGTASDSAPTSATATTTGPGTSADTSSTGEGCSFVCEDMPAEPFECDSFAQDCPEGQKCAAYIPDGGAAWSGWRCVDVTGTDEPGEPCTMEEVASGADSCIKGAMCWEVDMNGDGYCVALCTGTAEAPVCENKASCTISADASLILCLPTCHPLLQDCHNPSDVCYPVNDSFACAADASGDEGQSGDPCEFINVCDEGLMCADAALVGMGCPPGSTGCCTPFCNFPNGACPNPDQQCVQYFDPMELPPNDPRLDIGVCGVPG